MVYHIIALHKSNLQRQQYVAIPVDCLTCKKGKTEEESHYIIIREWIRGAESFN